MFSIFHSILQYTNIYIYIYIWVFINQDTEYTNKDLNAQMKNIIKNMILYKLTFIKTVKVLCSQVLN